MAPPEKSEVPNATPAAVATIDPQKQKEADEAEKLNQLKTRAQIDTLDLAVTSKHFIKDQKNTPDGSESGTITFEKFPHLDKVVGLKHLIKPELKFVRVHSPNNELFVGTRSENGNYYTSDGKYIAVWDKYTFEASTKEFPTAVPPASIAAEKKETAPESKSRLGRTSFFGDSLSAGMIINGGLDKSKLPISPTHFDRNKVPHYPKISYEDSNGNKRNREVGAAVGGQQTVDMLDAMKLAKEHGALNDTDKFVIFGGVNDLASYRTPDQIIKNLRAMYEIANELGKPIVACTVTQWGTQAFIDRWNISQAKKHVINISRGKIPAETPPPKYKLSAEELDKRTAEVNRLILEESKNPKYKSFTLVDTSTATLDTEKFPRGSDQLHFTGTGSKNLSKYIMEKGGIS